MHDDNPVGGLTFFGGKPPEGGRGRRGPVPFFEHDRERSQRAAIHWQSCERARRGGQRGQLELLKCSA